MASTVITTLLDNNPSKAYGLKIHQVVAICGDGSLRDSSACSQQFRKFLETAPSERLSAYAVECLSDSFVNSGLVLQDVINELGRRLDYRVENGLYQGRTNKIGHDGIWENDDLALVVEVKTTDAYRISLDKLANYRDRLVTEERIPKTSSILIVVGREDTGDLEAQVRGSRHAWSIRLISVEALSKLVAIKERTEDPTTKKIHDLLVPFEYTKLDQIIDVVFDVAEDATVTQEVRAPENLDETPITESVTTSTSSSESDPVEQMRQRIVASVSRRYRPIVKKSGALYWSVDKQLRAAIGVSSHYESRSWPYWYAYHPQWDSFLKEAAIGLYILGCADLNVAFAIPFQDIHRLLGRLRKTQKGTRMYWHIDLDAEANRLSDARLRIVDPREDLPVGAFAFKLD